MLPIVDDVIRFGPIICSLTAVASLWLANHFRSKEISLKNIFVIGISASYLPAAALFIYGSFDNAVIVKLLDTDFYMAFAGAVLFVFICHLIMNSKTISKSGTAIGGGIFAASLGLGLIGAVIGAIIGGFLASSAEGDKNALND